MGMHWPPGEWGESDTAYYKGQISLQLLDHKIETVSFTRLPAYKTMRFNLKELCCFETCKWNHMKTQYIISIIVNLIACSAVFWKHVWVSLQGVRLCYSNFGTTGGNTQCFRGTSPQLQPKPSILSQPPGANSVPSSRAKAADPLQGSPRNEESASCLQLPFTLLSDIMAILCRERKAEQELLVPWGCSRSEAESSRPHWAQGGDNILGVRKAQGPALSAV